MMDLNLIIPFLKVYELGSITRAAEQLDVSQPAMSLTIKRLEESLGYPLFVRRGPKLEATPDAHSLAVHFREIESRLELALEKRRDMRVYVPESLLIQLPTLEGVTLLESPLSEGQVLDDLRSNRVDMAIDHLILRDNSLLFEPFWNDELVLVVRKDHPDIGDSVSLEQFLSMDHITLRLSRNNATALEKFSGQRLSRRSIKEVRSPSTMLLCIRDTNVICGSTRSLKGLIDELGLKIVNSPLSFAPIEYELIYHRRYQSHGTHKKVRQLLSDALENLGA